MGLFSRKKSADKARGSMTSGGTLVNEPSAKRSGRPVIDDFDQSLMEAWSCSQTNPNEALRFVWPLYNCARLDRMDEVSGLVANVVSPGDNASAVGRDSGVRRRGG